jgi:hypothetical protein
VLKYQKEIDRLERVQPALQHAVEHGQQAKFALMKRFETIAFARSTSTTSRTATSTAGCAR